ncbi:MAG TPA: hypothetical protein VLM83_06945 [Anaerolineales bacterium]|nr:hypothetical protein [Anaerolineales bacterium]
MFVNSDFSDLLRLFNDNGVRWGIPGLEFDSAWQHRVEVDFDDLVVRFVSRQDLIQSKRASGRPQDLIDADLLSLSSDESE